MPRTDELDRAGLIPPLEKSYASRRRLNRAARAFIHDQRTPIQNDLE
jgi:hypothetical protein